MAFKAVNEYGMDAELAERMNAKYDKKLEEDLQAWIEDTTGIAFDKPFADMLKDGIVLCKLVNKLQPNKIKKINEAGGLFKMQENITNFIRACREAGVPEASLFPTESLAQVKDMNQVLTCINAYKSQMEGTGSKSTGAKFKPVKSAAVSNATGKRKTKWEIKPGGSSGVSLLNNGSAGIMDRSKYTDAREQIKRQELDGKGATGEVSAWNKGSSDQQERLKYTDAREQIKRGEIDGKGTEGEISALNQGSAGMERLQYTDAREQIKRGEL